VAPSGVIAMMSSNLPEDATWRSWSDIHIGRLALGLIAGPLVPFGLLAWPAPFAGWLFGVIACAIGIALAEWSLLTGFAYIFFVSRLRGGIGRRESVLLGMGSASSISIAAYAVVCLVGAQSAPLQVPGISNRCDPLSAVGCTRRMDILEDRYKAVSGFARSYTGFRLGSPLLGAKRTLARLKEPSIARSST
jgi:hypothetical protein